MKTMEVDPAWLEEIRAAHGPAKGDAKDVKITNEKPAGSPGRRMTMDVDLAWLEDVHGETTTPEGSSAKGSGRKVVPPPLPPPPAASKPKRKAPPPIPREDTEDAGAKPTPRRSTRPPKR